MKKTSELNTKEKLAAPVLAVVAGAGGFALEVCFGKPVAEGVTTAIWSVAIFGGAAYVLPRLEDESDPVVPEV